LFIVSSILNSCQRNKQAVTEVSQQYQLFLFIHFQVFINFFILKMQEIDVFYDFKSEKLF